MRHTIMQLVINFHSIWFGIPLAFYYGHRARPQALPNWRVWDWLGLGAQWRACLAHQSPADSHTHTGSVWQLTCCIYVNLPHMAIAALELCARVWKLSKKVERQGTGRGAEDVGHLNKLPMCAAVERLERGRGCLGLELQLELGSCPRCSWRPAIALFKVAKVHAAKLKMQRNKSLATIKGHKIPHAHTHTQTGTSAHTQ